MKYLVEFNKPEDIKHYLVEDKSTGEKDIYIEGLFARSSLKNGNGRIYPKEVLSRECKKLQTPIHEGRLLGAIDHPNSAELMLQDAAIKIVSLVQEGDDFIGKAKIMKSTPKGSIAYNLAKEGVKFGTSTRGLGSLEEKDGVNYVCEDYNWLTSDLVATPSVADAWVQSICEGKEWIYENGIIKEDIQASMKKRIANIYKENGNTFKEKMVTVFDDFIKGL